MSKRTLDWQEGHWRCTSRLTAVLNESGYVNFYNVPRLWRRILFLWVPVAIAFANPETARRWARFRDTGEIK